MRFSLLAAMLALVSLAGERALAAKPSPTEADFLGALVRLDDREVGQGRTIRGFLGCLGTFHGGTAQSDRPVRIEHPSPAVFRVSALLASDTVFHFQLVDVEGVAAAVLRRVEYKVDARGYAQITDLAAKRAIVSSVCRTGFSPTLD
jgi:hypothetical protein